MDELDDELSAVPPTAERVAARALVLASVSCRALIEGDARKKGAEELRQKILPWLESIGAAEELEQKEIDLISTPLGKLSPEEGRDAGWRSEGMVTLGWALAYADLPPVHIECEPSDIANAVGFLDIREKTVLSRSRLRNEEEIENARNTYLAVHWRLRQLSLNPGPMDFKRFASECSWADLRLDDLELCENDLSIQGVRIDKLEYQKYRNLLSITQERPGSELAPRI